MTKGFLTTHVLDTSIGKPANNLKISLYEITNSEKILIKEMKTNDDGRTHEPILPSDQFSEGFYELLFHVGPYLKEKHNLSENHFLKQVPIQFCINDANQHYHIPLLLSPFGYSTYRGS